MLHQKRHEDKYSCLLLWNTEIQAKSNDVLYVDGMGPYLVVTSPPLDRTLTLLGAQLNENHSIGRFCVMRRRITMIRYSCSIPAVAINLVIYGARQPRPRQRIRFAR